MYPDAGSSLALILLVLIASAAWFWNDSLRARERMLQVCATLCRELGVQFLDQTVALGGLGITRSDSGNMVIQRLYRFEFSGTGRDRWQGRALLAGRRVVSVQFDQPEGVTILQEADFVSPGVARLPIHPDHDTDSTHS